MEIVATKLTAAGLASIARLRNLKVLHLGGTAMMTDEGLRVLATLPRLRHLRLDPDQVVRPGQRPSRRSA